MVSGIGFASGFGNDLKTAVEIDDMGYSGNGAAQHLLFQGGCDAHIFHRIFQAEAEIKDVLHLLAEIVVSHRDGVASALAQNQKQVTDVFQGGDMLQKGQCNQMGDLVGEILFFDGICDQPLFYIVSDHGAGHIFKPQRADALVYIFGCLLQIKTHIGNFMKPWETKTTNGAGEDVSNLISHVTIIISIGASVNGKPVKGLLKTLDRMAEKRYS